MVYFYSIILTGSFSAYNAAFMSVLLKTRRRISAVKGETSVANPVKRKVSHNDILSGGKKNFSVIRTKKVDISMLTGMKNNNFNHKILIIFSTSHIIFRSTHLR